MARILKSSLEGVWLMQTIKMSVPNPCKIEYTVRHKGKGNNDLRVRYGSYYHLLWSQVHDFEVEPGKSKTKSTEEKDDDTGSNDGKQDIRWRLSRAIMTKAIDWELNYTVTRLKDNTDATSECETTLTNEE